MIILFLFKIFNGILVNYSQVNILKNMAILKQSEYKKTSMENQKDLDILNFINKVFDSIYLESVSKALVENGSEINQRVIRVMKVNRNID